MRGRIGPDGELEPLDLSSLPDLDDAEAIAVCLLFSFRDPSHERCLNLWVVGDNLRKGAATNAVQVAELLHQRDLVRVPEPQAS